MIRKPRSILPHLSAEWQRMFPSRLPKTDFSDEVLVLGNFLMRQIDPQGKKPIYFPPAYPDDYQPSVTARSRGEFEE